MVGCSSYLNVFTSQNSVWNVILDNIRRGIQVLEPKKAIRQSLYVGISGGSLEEDVRSNLDVEDVQGTECLKELDSKCHEESPKGTLKRNN